VFLSGSANNTISERDHSSQILSETHYRSGFPHNHYGALPQSTSPNYQEARFRQQTSESALPPFPIHGSNVNQLQGKQFNFLEMINLSRWSQILFLGVNKDNSIEFSFLEWER